jgi:hypothetical protein
MVAAQSWAVRLGGEVNEKRHSVGLSDEQRIDWLSMGFVFVAETAFMSRECRG